MLFRHRLPSIEARRDLFLYLCGPRARFFFKMWPSNEVWDPCFKSYVLNDTCEQNSQPTDFAYWRRWYTVFKKFPVSIFQKNVFNAINGPTKCHIIYHIRCTAWNNVKNIVLCTSKPSILWLLIMISKILFIKSKKVGGIGSQANYYLVIIQIIIFCFKIIFFLFFWIEIF